MEGTGNNMLRTSYINKKENQIKRDTNNEDKYLNIIETYIPDCIKYSKILY